MPKHKYTVTIPDAHVVGETVKSLHVSIDGELHWFNKSDIDDESEVTTWDNAGDLIVSEQVAQVKGLL